MDLKLKEKTVLVTGASKGLGKASALALAREGADVIIVSRNQETLQRTQQEIERETNRKVISIAADVSRADDLKRLFSEVNRVTDKLFGLVCNAGGPPAGSFLTFDDHHWQKAFETNLLSVVRLIRGSLPLMEKEGGRIVAIASYSVKTPIDGLILSNTMRAGVQGLMKTLSLELAEKNILVNTICPGQIATERLKALHEAKAQREGKTLNELEEELLKEIPLHRYGRPEEFGQVVAYFLSPANTYMTGSTIMVDGGMVKTV
jgi:3-oxoacyl-[acyl-carrier protein] reductase